MIDWLYQEEGVCEGSFKSNFFVMMKTIYSIMKELWV